MKKSVILLVVMVVFAGLASAQAPTTPFSLYAGGALSVPNSPDGFSETWKTGYHGLLGLGYKFGPGIQFVGKAEYHNFGFDNGGYSGIEGGNQKIWLFGGDARYALGLPAAPIKPFFFGGVGMARLDWSEFSGSDALATSTLNSSLPEAQSKFYFNIGAGFELKTGPAFSLFAQGRYVSVATDDETMAFIPISLGLKFF